MRFIESFCRACLFLLLLLLLVLLGPPWQATATGIPVRDLSLPLGVSGDKPVVGPNCTVIAARAVAAVDPKAGVVRTVVWLPCGQSIRAAVWNPRVGLCYTLRRMGHGERGFTQIVGDEHRAVALVVTSADASLNDPRLLPRAVPGPLSAR